MYMRISINDDSIVIDKVCVCVLLCHNASYCFLTHMYVHDNPWAQLQLMPCHTPLGYTYDSINRSLWLLERLVCENKGSMVVMVSSNRRCGV